MTLLFRDIKSYQDTISTFAIPSLHERFEFIRQLGNVFLVKPDILKSYITEGYLGRIDANLLRPYLAQRADWGQAEKGLNDALGMEDPGDSKGLKDRFGMGRLSMIMKDLEPLNLRDHVSIPSLPAMPAMPAGMSMPSLTARAFASGGGG